MYGGETGLSEVEILDFFSRYVPRQSLPSWPHPSMSRPRLIEDCLARLAPRATRSAIATLLTYDGPMAHGRPRAEDVAAVRVWLRDTSSLIGAAPRSTTADKEDGWIDVTSSWRTASRQSAEDPGGAIMSARALVSGACKRILTELGHLYDEQDDLRKLYLAVSRALGLLTADDRREALFYQVVGRDGVPEAKERLGLSFDREADGQARQLDAQIRHAQHTIDAASALVLFLIETHLAGRA